MVILPKNKFFKIYYFYLLVLVFFSFFINLYYSNLGVFPIDTFLHYDSAYKILNNEYPIRDYWIVSGLSVDIIQALFFKIFGNNWLAYTIHPSIFNCVITVMTYHLFIKNKLSELKSFLFTLSFAILAYTISGTPFVDHHAVFFLLISTYLIISNIRENKNYIWVAVVIMLYLSFLSKQVPATYIAISYAIILTFFLLKKKDSRN